MSSLDDGSKQLDFYMPSLLKFKHALKSEQYQPVFITAISSFIGARYAHLHAQVDYTV